MSSSEISSPVAPAVENALGLFTGESEVARGANGQLSSCHVFSYQEDFDYLWGIGDYDGRSWTEDVEEECSIVLVYDGIPDDSGNPVGPDIDITPYITAYDWAVHFFLSAIGESEVPDVRLFILDVTSQQSNTPFAAQWIPALLPLMPWLQVYRLFDDLTELQAQSGRFGMGFPDLAVELIDTNGDTLATTNQDVTGVAEERVREAWVNNLTKPEGRHAVSNLIAPLVLAGELGRVEEIVGDDPQRAALAELLQTLGVIGDYRKSSAPVVSPLDTSLVEKNVFGQFDGVRFLLLDDQVALGYHDVLAWLLYGDGTVREEVEHEGMLESAPSDSSGELQSIADPGPLVESLFEVTGFSADSEQKVDWSQPRVLDSLPLGQEGDDKEFDVLLLDLRLFGDSTSDQKSDDEVEFLERLIEFYDQSRARVLNDDNLKRAVHAARERIGRGSGDSPKNVPELMHLALLPLLVSYVDPSLPIVLFSSTRQQVITEALSHRPSIITSFDKPVVSGYNERTSPRTHSRSLSDAISSALRLHESRFLWRRIAEVEWTHMPVFETKRRGWDDRMLDVYNLPTGVSPQDRKYGGRGETPRRNAGEQKPHILGEKMTVHALRRTLAKHFINYIARSRYFDFTTVPWEMLNGGLMPKHIIENANLTGSFNLPEDLSPRNYVGEAIGALRNKKAHGFGRPPHTQQKDRKKRRYRLAAMVLFLLFLDFIEGATAPQHRDDNLRKMRGYLRAHYDHVYNYDLPDHKELSPYHFASDSKVEWLEVVAFTASFAEAKATDPDTGEVLLSGETIGAINRIINDLTTKSIESKLWVGLGDRRIDKSTISSWFDPEPDHVTGPLQSGGEIYFAYAEFSSPGSFLRALGKRDEWPSDVKIELYDNEK